MAEGGNNDDVDHKVKSEALGIVDLHRPLPRLVVFDLDYTLWPYYCECLYENEKPYLYPQANGIIMALKEKGIDMAIASRSPASDIAKTYLENLGIRSIFVAEEIYPSWTHKTEHFDKIHKTTGVPYNSMLFFDDENRNIEAVSKMGVTCIYVNNGVNLKSLREGLLNFSHKCGSSGTV